MFSNKTWQYKQLVDSGLYQYKQFVIVNPQINVLLFAENFTYMH